MEILHYIIIKYKPNRTQNAAPTTGKGIVTKTTPNLLNIATHIIIPAA